MDTEIKKVELQYKELLEQLKSQAETRTNTIMNGKHSTNYKAFHYNQIKIGFFQRLQNLQTQRDYNIKIIRQKYSSISNPRPPTKAACLVGINYINTDSAAACAAPPVFTTLNFCVNS